MEVKHCLKCNNPVSAKCDAPCQVCGYEGTWEYVSPKLEAKEKNYGIRHKELQKA